jgi:plastocyanin
MKKIILPILIVAIIIGSAIYLSQKSNTNQNTSPTPSVTSTENAVLTPSVSDTSTGQKTYTVDIKDFAFNPSGLTIKKGDTITWTNNDSAAHRIKAGNGEFESGTLQNGGSFSFTFNNTGSFDYICTIHTSMTGNINVE